MFTCDCTTLLHDNVSAFFAYTWNSSVPVDEFAVEFHTRPDKVHKLELNDKLKGHLLLRPANLNAHDKNIIVGSASGDYSLQAQSTSPRNAYRREGLRPSSMNTNTSMRTHNYPRAANSSNHGRQCPAR